MSERIACHNCGYENSSTRSTCKQCRQGLSEGGKVASKRKGGGRGTLLIAIIAVLVLGGLAASIFGGDSEPAGPSKTMAFVMCEDFVEDVLKSPSSAEFARYNSNGVRELSGDRFVVNSYVDADNSFGANIRTQYQCTVEYTGNDNWRLVDLTTE